MPVDLKAVTRRSVLTAIAAAPLAAGMRASVRAQSPTSIAPAPPKPKPAVPSADFPFESKVVDVFGSPMHYVESGQGDPVLFVHGIPTSVYLWRNVLPFVAASGRRAIAVDNIGFGKSGKPDITYSWLELARYLEGFIVKLGLTNVTLVMHDLGGAIGLHYAWRNPANVKAFAYLEGALPPAYPRVSFASFGATEALFRRLRDPVTGRKMLIDDNFWVETFLPASVMRDLTPAEFAAYRAPFATVAARKSIYDMVQSLPIEGKPEPEWNAYAAMAAYWQANEQPKLVMYATPGRVTPQAGVDWAIANLKNVESSWVGYGIHFLQEDNPEGIGRAIVEWLRRRVSKSA